MKQESQTLITDNRTDITHKLFFLVFVALLALALALADSKAVSLSDLVQSQGAEKL